MAELLLRPPSSFLTSKHVTGLSVSIFHKGLISILHGNVLPNFLSFCFQEAILGTSPPFFLSPASSAPFPLMRSFQRQTTLLVPWFPCCPALPPLKNPQPFSPARGIRQFSPIDLFAFQGREIQTPLLCLPCIQSQIPPPLFFLSMHPSIPWWLPFLLSVIPDLSPSPNTFPFFYWRHPPPPAPPPPPPPLRLRFFPHRRNPPFQCSFSLKTRISQLKYPFFSCVQFGGIRQVFSPLASFFFRESRAL